jgi:hypothetical protein
MAWSEPELRPCGVAFGPMAVSGHLNPRHLHWAIENFMHQLDRLIDGGTRRNHAHAAISALKVDYPGKADLATNPSRQPPPK